MINSEEVSIENDKLIESAEALLIIESFFSQNLALFNLNNKYCNTSGHWGIEYESKKCLIFIRSDRGFLEVEIQINKKPILLEDFDEAFKLVKASSRNNILFTLNLIKTIYKLDNSPMK
jgi:hypothetical protein